MKMSLQNIVEFQFTANPTYGIQRLRMTPKQSERQKILSWEIILKGAKKEIEYVDHHGNVCVLLTFEKDTKSVSVLAQGCLLYTSPSPRDTILSRMPSSA